MLSQLQDVFASLQRHNVKYVVTDDIAAVLHGVPRATFDLPVSEFRLTFVAIIAIMKVTSLRSPRKAT